MKKIFTLGCILAAIVLGAMAPQTAKAAEASFSVSVEDGDYYEYGTATVLVGKPTTITIKVTSKDVTADAELSITSNDEKDVILLDKTTLSKENLLGAGETIKVTVTANAVSPNYGMASYICTLTSGSDTFAKTQKITAYTIKSYSNIKELLNDIDNIILEDVVYWVENEVVVTHTFEEKIEGYDQTCVFVQDETAGIEVTDYYMLSLAVGDHCEMLNGTIIKSEDGRIILVNNDYYITASKTGAPATPIVVSTKEDVLANVGKLVSIAGCNVSSENVLAKNDVEIGKVGYFEEKSTAKSVAIKNSVINLVGIVVAGGETPIICPREASDIEVLSTTAINNAEIDHTIFANEGRIYCDNDARIFTISGLDVTHMNGQLNGVYVVKTANKVAKVAVK